MFTGGRSQTVIANAIRTQLQIKPDETPDRKLISGHAARVNFLPAQLKVTLYAGPERYGLQDSNAPTGSVKRRQEIVLPLSTRPGAEQRPICADTRTKLVSAMAKGALAIDALPECVDRIPCNGRWLRSLPRERLGRRVFADPYLKALPNARMN